jgi:uncharacterized membrane protein
LRLRAAGTGIADVTKGEMQVIILGLILALLGLVLSVPILWIIGLVLLVVGVILWIAGAVGNGVGGRRHYY